AAAALPISSPLLADPPSYPYPYQGPFTARVDLRWDSPGSTEAPFSLPAADIRNGKLTRTVVTTSIPYVVTASGAGNGGPGPLGQSLDTWQVQIPALNWQTFDHATLELQCPPEGCPKVYTMTSQA